MIVLSLFDGISGGQLALKNIGIPITRYYASEIDKHAIAVTQKQHPETIQLGDINHVDLDSLPPIDLLIAGSPCQGFSMLGKQKGFEDDRSKLFFKFLEIRDHLKPRYWFLENVKMKKEWLQEIDRLTGVKGIEVNSYLFSAQSRTRYYWFNWESLPLPSEPSPLVIKDILDVDAPFQDYSIHTFYPVLSHKSPYGIKGIGGLVSPDATPRNTEVKDFNHFRSQQRVVDSCGKYECVTASRNSLLSDFRTEQRVFNTEGKHPCLLTKGNLPKLKDNLGIRQPTVLELERLQGLTDNYTDCICKTQRIKAIGNGWNIPTIEFLFKPLISLL